MSNQVYVVMDTEYDDDSDTGYPVVDRVFATEALAAEYVALCEGAITTVPPSLVLTALPPHLQQFTIQQYVPANPKERPPSAAERRDVLWLDRVADDGAVTVSINGNGRNGVWLVVRGADETAVRDTFAKELPAVKAQAVALHKASVVAARKAAATRKRDAENYERGLAIAAAHGFHPQTPEQVLAKWTDEELAKTLARLQAMEKDGGHAISSVSQFLFNGPKGAQYPSTTFGTREITQEQRRRESEKALSISRQGLT